MSERERGSEREKERKREGERESTALRALSVGHLSKAQQTMPKGPKGVLILFFSFGYSHALREIGKKIKLRNYSHYQKHTNIQVFESVQFKLIKYHFAEHKKTPQQSRQGSLTTAKIPQLNERVKTDRIPLLCSILPIQICSLRKFLYIFSLAISSQNCIAFFSGVKKKLKLNFKFSQK